MYTHLESGHDSRPDAQSLGTYLSKQCHVYGHGIPGSRSWGQELNEHLFECCVNVIVQLCALGKVHRDWILAGGHVDHGRGHGKQALVACEVLHPQRSAHDDELQRGAAA